MITSDIISDTSMNDREMLEDILQTSRHMAVRYINAALECNSEITREALSKLANEKIRDAELVNKMLNQKGWYAIHNSNGMREATNISLNNIQ